MKNLERAAAKTQTEIAAIDRDIAINYTNPTTKAPPLDPLKSRFEVLRVPPHPFDPLNPSNPCSFPSSRLFASWRRLRLQQRHPVDIAHAI